MSVYMKHPVMGNAHVPASQQTQREADGWVRWPRTPEQKLGICSVQPTQEQVARVEQQAKPRGRPRKVDQ